MAQDRKKVTPGHGQPLRQWASPSYDPSNGRAASAFTDGKASSHDGERVSPHAYTPHGQPGRGSPTFAELDKARSTHGHVLKRPQG